MTDEKLKCPTKYPSFVSQNVQRVTKSFREAWYLYTFCQWKEVGQFALSIKFEQDSGSIIDHTSCKLTAYRLSFNRFLDFKDRGIPLEKLLAGTRYYGPKSHTDTFHRYSLFITVPL